MSLPNEAQLQQALSEQRAQFESDLSREMLETAKMKCFPRCFSGTATTETNTPNTTYSATPLSSTTTAAQQTCMKNCLDKFLEARTIIFKNTMKQMK